MATKTKAKAKAATKSTTAKVATATNAGAGPDRLLARLPALDDTHRDAFASQFTDAQCMQLGIRTKSAAVRDGALAWASEAAPAVLDAVLGPSIDYTPERVAWIVELVVRLDTERATAGLSKGSQSAVR